MANASYYLNLMTAESNKKKALEKRKSEYEPYLEKLKELVSDLTSLNGCLNASYNSFNSGGYIDSGVTLDRGVLKDSVASIENEISVLNNVISKTALKIEEFAQQIVVCQNNYNSYQASYYRALKENNSAFANVGHWGNL